MIHPLFWKTGTINRYCYKINEQDRYFSTEKGYVYVRVGKLVLLQYRSQITYMQSHLLNYVSYVISYYVDFKLVYIFNLLGEMPIKRYVTIK